MTETIVWTCRCGERTFRHIEWCARCGNHRPAPPKEPPSHKPSIMDDLKKD